MTPENKKKYPDQLRYLQSVDTIPEYAYLLMSYTHQKLRL